MKHAKHKGVSTRALKRRINRALAHSRVSVWFPDASEHGPYMIFKDNAVQASGIEDIEMLARELGVMREWETWDRR
jgi:hypothetical protein